MAKYSTRLACTADLRNRIESIVMTSSTFSISSRTVVITTEMHSGGEPVRVIEQNQQDAQHQHGCQITVEGRTLLDKRRYVSQNLDALRRFLLWEPRGHHDMYGALLVEPDHPDSTDMAVIFMTNDGYSTMCGHAVIALARYAVDRRRLVNPSILDTDQPEIAVSVQCPCGLVRAFVERRPDRSTTGNVRFHSVPAFAFALGVEVNVKFKVSSRSREEGRTVTVDIGYGGAFYAIVDDRQLGLDVRTSRTSDIVDAATAVTEAVKSAMKLHHPDSSDLAFLYGTIVTDGADAFSEQPTANLTVFADREVDRAPTGSGVTARVAVQYARRLIGVAQRRVFQSAATDSQYTGSVVKLTKLTACSGHGTDDAVIVEVSGTGHYTGSATFTAEDDDQLKLGFLLK